MDNTSHDTVGPKESGNLSEFLDKHYMDGSQEEVEDPKQERVEYFEEVEEQTPEGPKKKLKKIDVPPGTKDEDIENHAAKKTDRVFLKRIDGENGKTLELSIKHGFTERKGDDKKTRHQYETVEFEKDFKALIDTGFGAQELHTFRTGITRASKHDGGTITSWGDGHLPDGWGPDDAVLHPMQSEELDRLAETHSVSATVSGTTERFDFGNGRIVFREKQGDGFHIYGHRTFGAKENPETSLRLPMVSLEGPKGERPRVDCVIRVNRVEINLDDGVAGSRGRVKFSVEGQTPKSSQPTE